MAASDQSDDPLVVLGNRLRARREGLHLTQEKVGQSSGLHATWISDVEAGRRNLNFRNFLRLAEALSMDPGELARGLKPGR